MSESIGIRARKPSPAVVWHEATAAGKREERVKRGRSKEKFVWERNRFSWRKENSKLARIKEKERALDGGSGGNSGPPMM